MYDEFRVDSAHYNDGECKTFIEESYDYGIESVEHYNGRYSWEGPAVRIRDSWEAADFIAAISVPVQQDQMGLGVIVYPVARCALNDAGEEAQKKFFADAAAE
jgi:hypothetical protein